MIVYIDSDGKVSLDGEDELRRRLAQRGYKHGPPAPRKKRERAPGEKVTKSERNRHLKEMHDFMNARRLTRGEPPVPFADFMKEYEATWGK